MTARKPDLRTVSPDERAPVREVHTKIADALDGSSRDVLASMRKALAKKLDAGDIASNAIASAYKELRELDRLIRGIDAEAAMEEAKRNADSNRPRRSFDASAL